MSKAITSIKLTAEEIHSGQLSSHNIEKALVSFERDGVFMIENGVTAAHLDKLQSRMIPEGKKLYADSKTHRNFGKDTGNIQQDPVPYPEYLFEDIIANRFVSQISECILGPNPVVRFYSANTAFKATQRQPVHVDCDFEFKDHCFGLCVNINLVQTSPQNGATELWPGSHRYVSEANAQEEIPIDAQHKLMKEYKTHPVQPCIPKGAIIVRDFRLWHAGMPNQIEEPRIMLVTVQFPHWYRSTLALKLPESSKAKVESMNSRVKIAAEYYPDTTPYLTGSHDHTFAQTF